MSKDIKINKSTVVDCTTIPNNTVVFLVYIKLIRYSVLLIHFYNTSQASTLQETVKWPPEV